MIVQVASRGPEKRNATTSGDRGGGRIGSGKDYKQEKGTRKGQVPSAMERMYSRKDTWESRKNLKNMMELVEEFEREYRREEEEEVR